MAQITKPDCTHGARVLPRVRTGESGLANHVPEKQEHDDPKDGQYTGCEYPAKRTEFGSLYCITH